MTRRTTKRTVEMAMSLLAFALLLFADSTFVHAQKLPKSITIQAQAMGTSNH
jgi:hypothetical protein